MNMLEEAIAVRRYKLIAYLDRNIEKGWTDKNITPLLENLPSELQMENSVNWRTICRWRQQYIESNGNIASLAPAKGTGNKTVRTIGDEALLMPTLHKMLRIRRLKIATHYREYVQEVDAFNSLVLDPTEVISRLSYKSFKARFEKLKEEAFRRQF